MGWRIVDKNKIEIGDIVTIDFSRGQSLFDYEVLYTPCATGDCWHLKKDKQIFYVQQFETMALMTKKKQNESEVEK